MADASKLSSAISETSLLRMLPHSEPRLRRRIFSWKRNPFQSPKDLTAKNTESLVAKAMRRAFDGKISQLIFPSQPPPITLDACSLRGLFHRRFSDISMKFIETVTGIRR
jgi:hypothetical protein